MASAFPTSTTTGPRTEFERQRGELIQEIAESFEHVLANINKLNRNLEAVITVGNEFSSVEALWSTFENVMGDNNKDAAAAAAAAVGGGEEEVGDEGEGQAQHEGKERESKRRDHGQENSDEEL